jgi:hypothetical protein
MVVTERAVERHVTSIFEKLDLVAGEGGTAECSPHSPICATERAADRFAGRLQDLCARRIRSPRK